MAQQKYYPEEILVEKMQSGEYGWLDYINHFLPSGRRSTPITVKEKGLTVCEDSAAGFVRFKDEQLEAAMKYGNA